MNKYTIARAAWALGVASITIRPTLASELTFDQRVQAQEAIERVYHAHLVGPVQPFAQAIPRETLERKVRTYLRESVLLADVWKTTVTDAMLEREVERQTMGSKMPERLRELRSALRDDPILIRECLARPVLVDRLAKNFFAYDAAIHADARKQAIALRDALTGGAIDIHAEHPLKHLAVPVPDSRDGQSLAAAGTIAPVRETIDALVVSVVLDADPTAPRVAHYVVPKTTWESWLGPLEPQPDESSAPMSTPSAPATETPISASTPPANPTSCGFADVWENGRLEAPTQRYAHTAVWTGTHMIVWGGHSGGRTLATGARYDPATDTWTQISTVNAPSARMDHRAVWTGTSMLVWGGNDIWGELAHGGGRYDPETDTWQPMSEVGEPAARRGFSAVWTGSTMVVWGGWDWYTATNSGGRYDPMTDTWTPTSVVDAPTPRHKHTAVWTGSRMVVWGGINGYNGVYVGGLYDPVADSWTPTAQSLHPVSDHTAVWTGSLMLIWGGSTNTNEGWRYDPSSDTWSPMSRVNAPSGRYAHSAVWTGSRMIIWGGYAGTYPEDTSSGGAYDPATNSWAPLPESAAPEPREQHTAVWTGSLMVVMGGSQQPSGKRFNGGGRYDPASATWTPIGGIGQPRADHAVSAVWTGNEMIIWGGFPLNGLLTNAGSRYNPAIDAWTPTTQAGAPVARLAHTAVWAGGRMIIWGGDYYSGSSQIYPVEAGVYDPSDDTWMLSSPESAPPGRWGHLALSTGDRMVVWGGFTYSANSVLHNSGAFYDPATDSWTPLPLAGAPTPRQVKAGVWTGRELVVWGGVDFDGALADGARYDPSTGAWRALPSSGSPSARLNHTAVWSGREMIIWGGTDYSYQHLGDGSRYDPASDSWTPISMEGAPKPRYYHSAVWSNHEMIVWGGDARDEIDGVPEWSKIGGRYDPQLDRWTPTTALHAPTGRLDHTAVWTGTHMIVWGGANEDALTGGQYRTCSANTAPTANAGGDRMVECTASGHGVATLDASASTDPDSTPGTTDDIVLYEWIAALGLPSESILATGVVATVSLPLGTHSLTLRVTDRAGEHGLASFDVAIADTIPPNVIVSADPALLWPPNHRMVDVRATVTATDACGPVAISLISVASSESDDAPGTSDGHTTGDITGAVTGTADFGFALRAERDGSGGGRAYTASYSAIDASGNAAAASANVVVPHDSSGDTEPIDLATMEMPPGTVVSWTPVEDATVYNVVRGLLSNLREDGGAITLGSVLCLELHSLDASTAAGAEDLAMPPLGNGFFYLVEYIAANGERSGYGAESAGLPRIAAPGSCE